MDYFKSEEFQKILNEYIRALENNDMIYLDSDDFMDISEYYLDVVNDLDRALEASEYGAIVHPSDDALKCNKAKFLVGLKRVDEARKLLNELDPEDDTDLYYVLAQVACADGDGQEADSLFSKWLDIEREECDEMKSRENADGRMRDAYMHIIVSLKEYCTDSTLLMAKWLNAYKDYFPVMGESDNDIEVARLFHELNMLDEEIEMYQRILDTDPYMPCGYSYLSSLLCIVNRFEEAITAADYAMAIEPDDVEALSVRAHSYYQMEKVEKALPDFLKLADKIGVDQYATVIGRCYVVMGKNELAYSYLKQAEQNISKIRTLAVDKVEERLFIASSYLMGRFFKDALRLINIIMRTSQDTSLLLLKGTAQLGMGDTKKASYSFAEAVANSDELRYDLLVQIGMLYYDEGYLWESYSYFMVLTESWEIPEHANGYVFMAQVAYDMGVMELFWENVKLACLQCPDFVRSYWKEELKGVAVKDYFRILKEKIKDSSSNV